MALVPFSTVDATALRWNRTGETPTAFTLRAGDQEVATLTWEAAGGSTATARTEGATWTLSRAGFLAPTVVVRLADAPEPVARLSAHLARHEILITGTRPFRLRHVSHLVPAWRLTTDRGEEVLYVEPVPQHRALQGGAVTVSSDVGGPATLLLIVLTWYFVVVSWFEDEAIEALAPYEGPDPPIARGDPD